MSMYSVIIIIIKSDYARNNQTKSENSGKSVKSQNRSKVGYH